MEIISVIVPIYKGKEYINKIIKMIENNYELLNKEIYNLELIFVNDYPNETIKINDYLSNSIKIKIINNIKNLGIHGARVEGLKSSIGEIIYFLDQDDEIDNIFLKSQLKYIEYADAVVCNGYQKYEEKNETIFSSEYHMQNVIKLKTYKMWNEIISPGQVLIKRKAIPTYWINNILKNNGSDDYFLWILMLNNNSKFELNSEKLYYHCVNSNNFSKNLVKMNNSNYEVCKYLKEYSIQTKKIAVFQEKFVMMNYLYNLKSIKYYFYVLAHPIVFINRVVYYIKKKIHN